MRKQKQLPAKGSITIFLSMTLLIIISLIMTTVEAIRAYTISTYSERALYTAMDSILAEFYYPLFKEYHIFGLDGGYGSEIIQDDMITNKMKGYMEYTFTPNKDLYLVNNYIPVSNFNLYGIEAEDLSLNKYDTLMDFDGDFFVEQAVEYSKYQLMGNGAELLLDKLNVLGDLDFKEIEVTQSILKEKVTAEKTVSIMNDDIISLMEIYDGIKISRNGPRTNNNGKLQINNIFIKKICNSKSTILNPYPYNDWVSSSLDGHYIQPDVRINQGVKYIDLLIENNDVRDEAQITYRFKSLIDQSEIEDEKERKKINQEIQEAKKLIEECNKKEKKLISDFKINMNEIRALVNNTLPMIQNAIPILDRLVKNQGTVTNQIVDYEKVLKNSKNLLKDDLYNNLLEDFSELEKYKSSSSNQFNNYNFQNMKDTLLKNQNVLIETKKNFNYTINTSESSWIRGKEVLSNMRKELTKYSHNNLQLDYSALVRSEEKEDVLGGVSSLLGEGIMWLVVDNNDISEKTMKNVDQTVLPSYLYDMKESESKVVEDGFGRMNMSNIFDKISELLDTFIHDFDMENMLTLSGDALGKSILLQEYFLDHFRSFDSEQKSEMPTSLDYEIEYIIQGKNSDYENLKSVISTILVFRMLMNSIALMTNKESSAQARTMATALVGFTGIPVLVTITKTILLFIWGLAEGLVDVAAILEGKGIPLFKKQKDFLLKLVELPLINKVFIQTKVSKIKNNNSSLLNLTYPDYIKTILLLKRKEVKAYRALDLIQMNLQNNYSDSFHIKNCIFGFQVTADFKMDSKFVTLPFIKNLIGQEDGEYSYQTTKEYSY